MVDREGLDSVETTGASVTEAIAEGLARLELELDEVEVEVLAEATRGLFGLGSRDARVRVRRKRAEPEPAAAPAPAAEAAVIVPREPAAPPVHEEPRPVLREEPAPAAREELVAPTPAAAEILAAAEAPSAQEEGAVDVARSVLVELLGLMGVDGATVDAHWSKPAEDETESLLMLDVKAPTDALIGPRGETLSALQYVLGLIVGRERGGRMRIVVDVNGYKVRRERQLRQLADRLARQATDTHRTVVLEPMPAFERRIVHLALRDHPGVTTESIGEGDRRKVTIIPRLE